MFVKWYPFDLTSQKTNISQIYNYIFTFGMLMLFFFMFLVFLLLLILFLFLVFLSELPPKIILKPKYNWIFIKKWVKISIKLDPFSLIYINIYIYIKYAKNKIYIFMLKAPAPPFLDIPLSYLPAVQGSQGSQGYCLCLYCSWFVLQ